jgi:hypothetical protein
MRHVLRLGVAAVAGVLALAFAGGALAALNPKFIVVSPPNTNQGATSITASVDPGGDPVAKVTMYAPLGYQLNAPDPGAKVGDVKATVQAADLGGSVLPLKGQIMATGATDPAVAQASASCDNADHAAVWTMQLAGDGQQLAIPMFVDQTTGAEAKLSVFKIVMCLPPPDVAAGTPGRAPFGAKLLSATFDVNAFTNPPATGQYRWRSVWTPYAPKTGQVNTAGTAEAQSIVRLPTSLTLTVRKQHVLFRHERRTLVTISGRLSEAGMAIPAEQVSIQAGPSKTRLSRLKAVMTTKNGTFVKKLYLEKPRWFMAEVVLPNRVTGAAKCTASFDVGCVSSFIGGVHVLSQVVRVTP